MTDHERDLPNQSGHTAASFTDLMASLMVIFVLLFVATVNNVAADRTFVQNRLLESLRAKLTAQGFDSASIRQDDRDPFAIVVVMPDSLLFELDKADVREGGRRHLVSLGPALSGIVCDSGMLSNIENVVVEGHTDTTYYASRRTRASDDAQTYNMRLSQGRSMAVVRVVLEALRDLPQRNCFRGMIAASGRGQEELLPGISGDDKRQRRVIFKIRVRATLADEIGGRLSDSVLPDAQVTPRR